MAYKSVKEPPVSDTDLDGDAEVVCRLTKQLHDDNDGEIEDHLLKKYGHNERLNRFVFFSAACASLNSFLLGYDIGVMGGAMTYIKGQFNLTMFEHSFLIAVLNVVAIFGAATSNVVSDRFGRTKTIFTASMLFFAGNLLMALAIDYNMLVGGRLLVGIGTGVGFAIDPLYISEMSPARYRGGLVTMSELSINVGITFGFLLDWVFSYTPEYLAWRMMIGMGCVIPLQMMYLSGCVMCETPRWLLSKDKIEKADIVLNKMFNDGAQAEGTKREIVETIEFEKNMRAAWSEILLPNRVVRRMLLVVIGVVVANQTCGIDAIIYYIPIILERAGVDTRRKALGIQAIMGIFKTLILGITAWLLDRPGCTGRRPLLLVSLPGCGLALLLMALAYDKDSTTLSIAAIFTYAFFFSIGIGPICWLYASEVFPMRIRAKGMSLAISINRMMAVATSLTYLDLTKEIGDSGTFYFYAGLCAGATLFAALFVPETKGRTLEEMYEYFQRIVGPNVRQSETEA